MKNCNPSLRVPDTCIPIVHGSKVKLGRFDNDRWTVCYGWFTWGGNRPFCGWHLISCDCKKIVKPLQLTDLDDIYIVEQPDP